MLPIVDYGLEPQTSQHRYDTIHAIEQGLTYTYNNGLVTFHTPSGDRTFDWNDEGLGKSLQWLVERKCVEIMIALENLDPKIRRQYEAAYGPFAAGDYRIGDTIAVTGCSGEVIWSFRKDGTGPLTYVVDDTFGGWPVEAPASQVHGKVTPWK